MSAAGFIGRVGGLAVALGVGAALLDGTAVAWADSPGTGSSSAHDSSAKSAHDSSTKSTASAGSPHATGHRARTSSAPQSMAHSATPASATPGSSTPGSSTVTQTAGALGTLRAAPAATASVSSPAPSTPTLPTDSALDLTLLAYSRRETGDSARVAAAATPSATATTMASSPTSTLAVTGQNTALIMGPSGVPIPKPTYIQNVLNLYIAPSYPTAVPSQLDTPEGLYPITGVKSLPLNVSVQQGLTILATAVAQQIAAGNTATVFGYSQSAIISSLLMSQLPSNTPAQFVLVGNEMNPNGGFLARFPGLKLPSLGLDFYGATPENAFPTTNYTLEYDGFADFPRYPLNVISDLNAGLGIIFVHTQYANLTQDQLDQAIALPTTSPTQHYYIIPTENLPLLEPLRLIPVIGKPLADLLQPALKVIVNLGYGDPKYGWSNEGNANVQVPFGVFPDANWGEVAQLFVAGIAQGIKDFAADVSPGGSVAHELASLNFPQPGPGPVLPGPGGVIEALKTATTDVALFVSNAAASLYSALLPTADVVNAIVTMLPAYAVTLFLDGIQQALSGDPVAGLVNAFGRPVAAGVGLVTTASLIEVLAIIQAVQGVFGVQTDK
ncbi:PE-PPE domain-containing protein [Mycolicibacterium sp. CH28]|uniref:PE-PPE domain-containing protein n=1 Tax=Mycolicibacterium sp. CH28 TaxID=2512237 RepID=UPI001080B4AD|nr:PE-PPE domain-containing protein [Mycolicibacterium sp. CH28]TGD87495.1 PE-PPE domain-containing protein [Mycolicibacterium sp. CH28]